MEQTEAMTKLNKEILKKDRQDKKDERDKRKAAT